MGYSAHSLDSWVWGRSCRPSDTPWTDHGRLFDEYQGIEELRPYPVEPHPEQTVG
jgi:hypothetical protein